MSEFIRPAAAPRSSSLQHALANEFVNNIVDELLDFDMAGINNNIGGLGWFIGRIDPGKIRNLPGPRFFIEPFRVARLAYIERRIDKDLDKFTLAKKIPRHAPFRPERRDKGRHHNQARVNHQFRNLANAADILNPVRILKAEIAIEPVTHIVEVAKLMVEADGVKMTGIPIKMSRTPGKIETSSPDFGSHTREIMLELGYSEKEITRFLKDGLILESPADYS